MRLLHGTEIRSATNEPNRVKVGRAEITNQGDNKLKQLVFKIYQGLS